MTRRKIWNIDHPPVVLLVGPTTRTAELEARLHDTTEFVVERVERGPQAIERIGERPVVDCCWIAPETTTETWLDLVESVGNEDPVTRIVYAPADGDGAVASRVTDRGASEYVAPDASVDERCQRVESAVDRALDRRHDATKRSMLDAIVEGLDVNVFAKDSQARHLVYSVDQSGEERDPFGLTDPEAFGTEEETLETAYRDDLAVIQDGRHIHGKVERYPEFQQGWQWTSKVPWREDGETRGLVGFTREISEWKQWERELLQQVGTLQRIPKYLTHDLRNPLAIARGYVQLARDGEPGALDTVEDSLDRMSDKLTEFHGLIAGGGTRGVARRPVDFSRIVDEVWNHVSLPGTDLVVDVDEDAWLLAEEDQLRTLLQNVFQNAIDHAGPRVTVRVQLADGEFSIGDDGPGLGDLTESDLFERGTNEANATGIGLAVVREAALLHGWGVEVGTSELGGARFSFTNCQVGRPSGAEPTDVRIGLERSVDVGDASGDGSTTVDGDVVEIRGGGANVWEDVDQCTFVCAPVEGDVRIEARIAGMEAASEQSKAGAMVRSSLEEGGAYAAVCRIADRFPGVFYRDEPDTKGTSARADGVDDGAVWVAIDRVGDAIFTAISADGEAWLPLDHRRVDVGETPFVGLFVSGVLEDDSVQARFENVSVRPLE